MLLVGPNEDSYNNYLSSLIVHVRKPFGMLVDRWRILQNALQVSFYINSRVVCLCMKLHIFCLDNGKHLVHRMRYEERARSKMKIQEWY